MIKNATTTAQVNTPRVALSGRAAYTGVALVIAMALGASLWGSTTEFARLHGTQLGGWSDSVYTCLRHAGYVVSGAVICHGWWKRRRRHPVWTAAICGGAVLLTVFCVAHFAEHIPSTALTDAGERLAVIALLVTAAREILAARGLALADLGIRRPKKSRRDGGWMAHAIGWLLLAVIIAGTQIRMYVAVYAPSLPVGDQSEVTDFGSRYLEMAAFLWTSVVEEMLLTAVVISLLTAARRPTWEWICIPALLRLVPHLYLGWPAAEFLLVGPLAALLFIRFRRVVPMIAAHYLFNAWVSGVLHPETLEDLHRRWAAAVFALIVAGCFIVMDQVERGRPAISDRGKPVV